jgi:hypothetical protein
MAPHCWTLHPNVSSMQANLASLVCGNSYMTALQIGYMQHWLAHVMACIQCTQNACILPWQGKMVAPYVDAEHEQQRLAQSKLKKLSAGNWFPLAACMPHIAGPGGCHCHLSCWLRFQLLYSPQMSLRRQTAMSVRRLKHYNSCLV